MGKEPTTNSSNDALVGLRYATEQDLVMALIDAAIQEKHAALAELFSWFDVRWIYDPWLRDVTRGILELVAEKAPLTAGTLARTLIRLRKKRKASLEDVRRLIEGRAYWWHMSYLGKLVHDEYRRTGVSMSLADYASMLELEKADVDDALREVSALPEKFHPVSLQAKDDDVVGEIIAEMEGKGSQRLRTGVEVLDSRLDGGLRHGTLTTIGGFTGSGKSVLAGQVALVTVLNTQRTVLYFSGEMTRRELVERWAAWISRASQLERRDYLGGLSAIQPLVHRDGPLRVVEGSCHADRIAQLSRSYAENHNLALVVVDYVQLYHGGSQEKNRQLEVAYVTRTLKQIAMKHQVPVIGVSQVNRSSGDTPRMSSLRESGAIEQDSDNVLMVVNKNTSDASESVQLVLAKVRNGAKGSCVCQWDKPIFRFRDQDEFD